MVPKSLSKETSGTKCTAVDYTHGDKLLGMHTAAVIKSGQICVPYLRMSRGVKFMKVVRDFVHSNIQKQLLLVYQTKLRESLVSKVAKYGKSSEAGRLSIVAVSPERWLVILSVWSSQFRSSRRMSPT